MPLSSRSSNFGTANAIASRSANRKQVTQQRTPTTGIDTLFVLLHEFATRAGDVLRHLRHALRHEVHLRRTRSPTIALRQARYTAIDNPKRRRTTRRQTRPVAAESRRRPAHLSIVSYRVSDIRRTTRFDRFVLPPPLYERTSNPVTKKRKEIRCRTLALTFASTPLAFDSRETNN
jgi:hypothetical protein